MQIRSSTRLKRAAFTLQARHICLLTVAVVFSLSSLLLLATSPVRAQSGGSTLVHVVSWGDTLASIARRYGVSTESIILANEVAEPDHIYAGQRLVIPGAQSAAAPAPQNGMHTIVAGENLFRISLLYDVSVEALMAANGIIDANQVTVGQQLTIPSGSDLDLPAASPASSPTAQSNGDYIVQPGDTVFAISQKFGVSATALADANSLINPAAIYAGQRLRIPGTATASSSGYSPAQSSSSYIVQPGETLTSIAARYGTTAWVLAQMNNISNLSLLYSGQTLTVPASDALTQSQPTQSSGSAASSGKSIVVDVSDQRTYVYENGQLIWTFVVSTGIPGRDTWRGNFQIQNKIPNAYASTWDLQMPYWLGFYWAGPLQNGFHALPILSNGVRLWEGLLGQPASYGCVILSQADAITLYNWVDVGTPVTVRN